MATTPRYNVPFRRKRTGQTNYVRRLDLLKSRKPRLVIRKTLAGCIVQLVEYQPDGDKVLCTVRSSDLTKYGLTVINGNIPVSYLTGVLIAKQAKLKKITDVVVDVGLQKLTDRSRIYAVIKGVREGGLTLEAADEVLPDTDRALGKHIEAYAKLIEKDAARYRKQFSQYLAKGVDPKTISKVYQSVEEKILAK